MEIEQDLPSIEKQVTQERIKRYAQASGDFNPVHLDAAFAAKTPFGRTIAHGMMGVAFISEMMTRAFESRWLEGGHLKMRFKAPIYAEDLVTTFGHLKEVTEERGSRYARYAVGCRSPRGEEVIVGEATVRLAEAEAP